MIDQDDIFSRLNRGMLEERGRSFTNNLKKNIPFIRKHGGLEPVIGSFSGKHVLVVGSAPSLDGCYEQLNALSRFDDIVFVASDMALKPLAARGINPRFVITCETTPVDFFSDIDTGGMHLLSFSCSSHSNIRRWSGKISFFNWMVDGDFYNGLWKLAGEDLGSVATGSIVTTQAVSILLGCGIASLLLVGNDMAFFDRFYASGTARGEKKFHSCGRFSPAASIDMNRGRAARDYQVKRGGELFYTNNQFLAARMWLDRLFGSAPYPVADCSSPGCSESAVHKISLDDYLSIFNEKYKGGDQ